MKKLIGIAIITLGFTSITFAQKAVEEVSTSEKDLVTFLDENQDLIKKNNAKKKLDGISVQKKEVSAEKKYKLARTRMMRDPISRNLYNEKFRRYNGYRYNNRPLNHNYIR